MLFKRKKGAPSSLLHGLLRGVPGGAPPIASQEVWHTAEELAAMSRFRFDPTDPQGKVPLGLVGATMKPMQLRGGRVAHAAMGGTLLGAEDDRHRFLCCGNRSGKGRSHLLPLLITERENSIFSIDPKGDHARETALWRASALGQRVGILDGFKTSGPACASLRTSFNPLQGIDASDVASLVEQAALISDALIVPSGRDTHWDETARQFLEGVIMHVVTHPDITRPRTLVEVRHQIMAHADRGGELESKMARSTAAGGAIAAAAAGFFEKEDRERSGTLSTLRRHLHFLGYPAMEEVLQDSDLKLEDLLSERMTLYACMPATMLGPCAGFLRMLVNLMLSAFERSPNRQAHQHQSGAHRCIAILDEFAALGYMKSLADAAGQIAGLGCTLYPVLQDMSQLKVYGDKWETFLGNAGTLTFFGNADLTTLEWIEKRLGTTQVHSVSKRKPSLRSAVGEGDLGASYSVSNHPLMTLAEIARVFDRDDPLARQLVFLPSVGPVIMQRVLYDQHEAFEGYRSWMRKHGTGT